MAGNSRERDILRKKVAFAALDRLLEDSEDDEVEEILQFGSMNVIAAAMAVRSCVGTAPKAIRNPEARVLDFCEMTVPRFTDYQFREHFRMPRETFEELCRWVAPHFPAERTLPLEKKMLATVCILGNKDSYRGTANLFGVNKGCLHRVVSNVCKVLTSLRAEVIKCPERHQLDSLAQDFAQRCGFPGVVGAIDGTHIQIPGPSEHRESFINRKNFPSMQLQVVCNHNLVFLDVTTGWPGSVHDARVFRNSPLKQMLEDGVLPARYHLLGDSAYPLTPYLLVPYRDNGHLSAVQRRFNVKHSATRVEVERSIGLLKGKFRRLKYLDMTSVPDMPSLIVAACVLHNFIMVVFSVVL